MVVWGQLRAQLYWYIYYAGAHLANAIQPALRRHRLLINLAPVCMRSELGRGTPTDCTLQ